MNASSLKELAGVIIKDTPRYAKALYLNSQTAGGDPGWVHLRNRLESLIANPDGHGVKCDWTGSSSLHACGIIRTWRRRLFRMALADWPVEFADAPTKSKDPAITFVFAFRGTNRLDQLQKVVASVFAQESVDVECVVIDLSQQSQAERLPSAVVYQHVATSHLPDGWYKSWAYNLGARVASAPLLVFHDGDICVPRRYGAQLADVLTRQEYEAASLQRFLFYLNEADTQRVCAGEPLTTAVPDTVLQNWMGGTIAIRKDAFFEIGGFDEGFVDWGGEDDEFFDRCKSIRHFRFGSVPFVHLWHETQSDRFADGNLNLSHVLPERLSIPVADRIKELRLRAFGNADHPDPSASYKSTLQR